MVIELKTTDFEEWIIESMSLDRNNLNASNIRDYQLEKIKETLSYVIDKSPFYKEKYKDLNISEIKSFEDFQRILPFTSSGDIIKRGKDFICVPQDQISRIFTLKTSGTTANSKRIYFTQDDLEKTVDFFYNGMKYLASEGDRILILMRGNSYGSIGSLLSKALEKLGCKSFVVWPVVNEREILKTLKDENINLVVGLPIQIYRLAKLKNMEDKYKDLKLKSVLLSGDLACDSLKALIEKEFKTKVYTHYGMTEMGFGGGVECSCLCGYHMREKDLYIEIIDPLTGLPLPKDKEGEVVFTTLNRQAMPLVRYRTGDMGRILSRSCDCSKLLPRLDYVKKRISEEISIDNIDINIGLIDNIMFKLDNLLDYKASIINGNILKIEVESLKKEKPISKEEVLEALNKSVLSSLIKDKKLIIDFQGEVEDIKNDAKRYIEII